MDTKKCNTCQQVLPLSSFSPHKTSPDGLAYRCKSCLAAKSREYRKTHKEARRKAKLKYKYGITPEQYDAAWEAQGQGCAICGKADKKLHIDHCHETGAFRGILCGNCNVGLGMFGDNISTLEMAVKYLTRD